MRALSLLLVSLPLLISETEVFSEISFSKTRGKVKLGIEVLLEKKIHLLKGKRIGLITNQTGRDSKLISTIELLKKHPQVNLVALLAPEHGLGGLIKAGEKFGTSTYKDTEIPVYSLYGETRRPTAKMLRGLDALIFEIQDIGTRSYTYISTMALAMEEAARKNIQFIVLDRPNPLGGERIEGPLLEPGLESFIGLHPVPTVHGMTIGELAKFYNEEKKIGAKLTVIKMEGWERSMVWYDTGLSWVPTSPWIPTVESAILYPGIGLVGETGLVSIGIGHNLPFQVVGSPWMSSEKLAGKLEEKKLEGVVFRPALFEPFFAKFAGQECEGVQIHIVDYRVFSPLAAGIHMIDVIRELYPDKFNSSFDKKRRKSLDKLLGGNISEELLKGERAERILKRWEDELVEFRKRRKPYLLY